MLKLCEKSVFFQKISLFALILSFFRNFAACIGIEYKSSIDTLN